jgi:hypothetical protein
MAEKEVSDRSFGIISFVFGVLSILVISQTVLAIMSPLVGLILSILGLIFGIIQLRNGKTGLAIVGIILSAIGLILNGIIILKFISHLKVFAAQCQAYGGCDNLIQAMAKQVASSPASNLTNIAGTGLA